MAANAKNMLDNSHNKLSTSDPIFSQLYSDLEINQSDTYIDNTFDLDVFNKKYENVRRRRQNLIKDSEQERLSKLNITSLNKKIHQYTIGEILFNLKNALFGILNDLLRFKFTMDTFIKQNRLFYLGLFILIIVLIIYFFKK